MSGDDGTRRLISLADLSDDDIDVLVRRALEHRVFGLYFALTSTRTMTAFTAGRAPPGRGRDQLRAR